MQEDAIDRRISQEMSPTLEQYLESLARSEERVKHLMSKTTEMIESKRALAGKLVVADETSLGLLAMMDSARWRKSLSSQRHLLHKVQAALLRAQRTRTVDRDHDLPQLVRDAYASITESMRFERLPVPEMGSKERERYEAELTEILDNALTEQEEAEVEEAYRELVQEVKQLEDE